jgi:hypothetical protein
MNVTRTSPIIITSSVSSVPRLTVEIANEHKDKSDESSDVVPDPKKLFETKKKAPKQENVEEEQFKYEGDEAKEAKEGQEEKKQPSNPLHLRYTHGKMQANLGRSRTMMVERLWFAWTGKYTSGRIHFINGGYISDIILDKVHACLHFYKEEGKSWVINGAQNEGFRFGSPSDLVHALENNCVSKDEIIKEMNGKVPKQVKLADGHARYLHNDGDCHYDTSWYEIMNMNHIIAELQGAERISTELGVDRMDRIDRAQLIPQHWRSNTGSWEGDFYYSDPCRPGCPGCLFDSS